VSDTWTPLGVAARVEATLLAPHATSAQVRALSEDARARACRGVCVAGQYVGVARGVAAGSSLRVVAVAGFPFGTSALAAKVAEVRAVAEAGADEVDVVAPYGRLRGGEGQAVADELTVVVSAAHEAGLACKVICETGWLDAAQLRRLCELAVAAGADWVKTSTGFGPRGASVDDVRVMRAAVGADVRIKAAGGIRTFDQAVALLEAGADSLGCSRLDDVLETPR
jgi:deoxyribose-phosphate aldolase